MSFPAKREPLFADMLQNASLGDVLLELHQIRYFLAVSRTLNFTRAAEECYVAQPSLTRAIKLLEAELGDELFRRERNLTHLTEFGRRMLPLLRQCYDSAQAAKNLASAIKRGAVTSLTLALSHTIDLSFLIAPLTELMRAFPGLELQFLRGTADEIVEFLKKGETVLAIAGPLGTTWDRFDSWPLFTEGFQAVFATTHGLADADVIAFKDLGPYRYLARPYCELAEPIEETFREHDLIWSGRHEMLSERDVVQFAGAGLGVAIMPTSAARISGLRHLAVDGLETMRSIHVYSVAGRERPAPAAALLGLLRARDWSLSLI